MRDNAFFRLPKWAQGEIARLETNLHCAKQQLASVQGATEDTNVHIRDGMERVNLPKDAWIEFTVDGVPIGVNIEGRTLRVRSTGTTIDVRPWACNTVTIHPRGR